MSAILTGDGSRSRVKSRHSVEGKSLYFCRGQLKAHAQDEVDDASCVTTHLRRWALPGPLWCGSAEARRSGQSARCHPALAAQLTCTRNRRSARNYLGRAGRSGNARLLGRRSSASASWGIWCPVSDRLDKSGASASPTETPQLCDTVADPHRNPTDETAHSGTLVMRVKGTENSRPAAWMRVSWAAEAFAR